MVTNALISVKLLEMGIDAGAADFWWSKYKTTRNKEELELRTTKVSKTDIPAWTLSSLFNMLPDFLEYEGVIYHWEYASVPPGWKLKYLSEDGETLIESESNSQFETVYHMLAWLHESGFELNDRYLYLK